MRKSEQVECLLIKIFYGGNSEAYLFDDHLNDKACHTQKNKEHKLNKVFESVLLFRLALNGNCFTVIGRLNFFGCDLFVFEIFRYFLFEGNVVFNFISLLHFSISYIIFAFNAI